MKNKGFTLIEIIIGASIMAMLLGLISGVYFYYSGIMNKSIKTLTAETALSEFYMNFDSEIKSITVGRNFFFDNLLGNFHFEFECFNPYNHINAPVLKIRYSKNTDTEKMTYYLKKEIFIKSAPGSSSEEILFAEMPVLKNSEEIAIQFISDNTQLTEYFPNTRIDKINLNITSGSRNYKWTIVF